MLSPSRVATLVRSMGFSQAAFVCAVCLLAVHVVNFEQWVILVLFGAAVDLLPSHLRPKGKRSLPARTPDPSTRAPFDKLRSRVARDDKSRKGVQRRS